MGSRRFTRLTNAFSKKASNLEHAVSLHTMHYNFCRPHTTLSKGGKRTPAMAPGVTDHVWSLEEVDCPHPGAGRRAAGIEEATAARDAPEISK